MLVFVSLHYKGAIMYLLPGIAIYGVDKIMALYAYHKAAPVATRMLSSDVLEISFKTSPGVSYNAGDYIFLNGTQSIFIWIYASTVFARNTDSHLMLMFVFIVS